MADLEVDRPAGRFDLLLDLGHHLPRPVVGVDEPLPQRIDLIAAEGVGHVGACWAVVILDQRIYLEALDSRQFGAGVVGHGVPVTGVGGVLVGAVQIARRGQPEAAARPGGQDHGLGRHRDEFSCAGVECGRTHGPARFGQHTHRHEPVLDADLLAHRALAQHPVQRLLDVLALGHRQHIGAGSMHAPHGVLTVLVLLELDSVPLEPLHHGESTGRGLIDGALVDDSVVGTGDLGDVVLGLGLARNHGVVDAVHAHGQRTRMPNVGLLQQQHLGAVLGGGQRRHGARGTTADHQYVAVDADRV